MPENRDKKSEKSAISTIANYCVKIAILDLKRLFLSLIVYTYTIFS